jgi:hypothetical protein
MLGIFEAFNNIFRGLLNSPRKIDSKKLPSQNIFYKDDFIIKIKRAELADIKRYEIDFKKDDLSNIISKVKLIVEKNLILPNGYLFEDLKSIDIVFIFLEIVKFTTGKKIKINYVNEEKNILETIEFNDKTFNYYNLDSLKEFYDDKSKCFNIDGYSLTLPSIGVENCLTIFLIMKSSEQNAKKYLDLDFDFTYFLSDKNFLTFEEIENLIEIFNFDMDEDEKNKVKSIIKNFEPLQKYSLIKDGKIIDINSKIDLENIWK